MLCCLMLPAAWLLGKMNTKRAPRKDTYSTGHRAACQQAWQAFMA